MNVEVCMSDGGLAVGFALERRNYLRFGAQEVEWGEIIKASRFWEGIDEAG
jgi:hypothetical protein